MESFGYVCFFKGRSIEVYATSSYQAQKKAAAVFQTAKPYMVVVMLAEKNGIGILNSLI